MKKRKFNIIYFLLTIAIIAIVLMILLPSFLRCSCLTYHERATGNLRAIIDNIASYGIYEGKKLDNLNRLWPKDPNVFDSNSYIRKKIFCNIEKDSKYDLFLDTKTNKVICLKHGDAFDCIIKTTPNCDCSKAAINNAKKLKQRTLNKSSEECQD